MAQLPERLGLDLPDPLAGHVELLPDLFQGVIAAVPDPEAQAQDAFLAGGERLQHFLGLPLQVEPDHRLDGRHRRLVLDEVAQVRILFLADGGLQGDRLLRDLQDLAHLVHRQVDLLGDLFRSRLAPVLLHQVARGPDQLVDRLDHVDRDADRARLVRDGARDGLPDPPGGVRAEFVAALVLELVHGTHQADVSFLDQVQELEAAVRVLLGNADDQTEVRLHHLLLGQQRLALALGDGDEEGPQLLGRRLGLLLDLPDLLGQRRHLLPVDLRVALPLQRPPQDGADGVRIDAVPVRHQEFQIRLIEAGGPAQFQQTVKEKLKKLKTNVDTLTLTATPIPRTLQFSLMGARDLSIINTPPPNRMPIVTELHGFNEEIIKEGIEYEVARGGQVFVIHNRVENIKEVQASIHRICPNVKTAIVHGKLDGKSIENVMFDFIQGDYDVLIATTIIESGLDIPNANTIFINEAQHFGLSELHQLRGRVGRSNRKAFCYLLAPPLNTLTHEARRRLKAIEEFSELGSGFNIAMQDLDIRGSGNLLGGEQSGFIADVGFETYQRILNEAMAELRESLAKEEIAEGKHDEFRIQEEKEIPYVSDFQIDTDLEIMFPDEYISNISERIRLYKELNEIENEESLQLHSKELVDRFGPLPEPAAALLDIVRVKWIAVRLGIEKILLRNDLLIANFISDPGSRFYRSPLFVSIMNYVNRFPKQMMVKQRESKLSLTIREISSVKSAIQILDNLSSGS